MIALINLLILIVVLVLICILAKWFVTYMGVPQPFNWIALLIVCLVCLYVLLHALTGIPYPALK